MSAPLRPFSAWPTPVRDAVLAAASGAHPHEAVGVLLAPHDGDSPTRWVLLPGGRPDGFAIDDEAWLAVLLAARAAGDAVRVLFHSHVDGPAALSARDLDEAMLDGQPRVPDADLVVVGTAGAAPHAVAHYRYVKGTGYALVERVRLDEAGATASPRRG